MRTICGLLIFVLLTTTGRPQECIFAPPEVDNLLRNELSGELAFEHIRELTRFHRITGTQDLYNAFQYIEQQAHNAGLQKVQLIEQTREGSDWSPKSAELWMLTPDTRKLASFAEVAVSLAMNSRSTHVQAELVDVGAGDDASDYENKGVAGKIVLAYGTPDRVMAEAVWKRKALGIVSYASPRIEPLLEHPDQIALQKIPLADSEGQPGTFAFVVSPRNAFGLRRLLAPEPDRALFGNHREAAAQKILLRVDIDAEISTPSKMWYVMAQIPGSEFRDEDIVLTAHVQEEKFSANDNASGAANLLEIGRTLARLRKDGLLTKPRRTIRFWWTTEIANEYRYFQDHPEAKDSMLVSINQDMVGAKQSIGDRVQQITRPPHSRASFLGDVIEQLVDYMVVCNNAYLPVRQAPEANRRLRHGLLTKPIFSPLGSREPYRAQVVPYFDNSDHLVFNEALIDVPAITLSNWPDELMHSTDDDLWNIDPTQLKRNAFIVAAGAWYLATLDDKDIPDLTAVVFSMGQARCARAQEIAFREFDRAKTEAAQNDAFARANLLISEAFLREQETLNSIKLLASESRALGVIGDLSRGLRDDEKAALDRLKLYFQRRFERKPPKLQYSDAEKEAGRLVPLNNPDLPKYFEKRREIQSQSVGMASIHPILAAEVFNFVDGRRSVYEIYRGVLAESRLVGMAGSWYYGKISLQEVRALIDKGVKVGALAY